MRILRREHPRTDHKGYVFEHILMYEDFYKCCLLRWGTIHHKNEIKTDNRVENLQGFTNQKHVSIHQRGKPRIKESRICSRCESDNTSMQLGKNRFMYTELWYKIDNDEYYCYKCYMKYYYYPVIDKPRRQKKLKMI
jgi:hypothetical protein